MHSCKDRHRRPQKHFYIPPGWGTKMLKECPEMSCSYLKSPRGQVPTLHLSSGIMKHMVPPSRVFSWLPKEETQRPKDLSKQDSQAQNITQSRELRSTLAEQAPPTLDPKLQFFVFRAQLTATSSPQHRTESNTQLHS